MTEPFRPCWPCPTWDLCKKAATCNGHPDWHSIETAPKDGTVIQAAIPGHGADNVIAWHGGLLDDNGNECGGWVFVTEQEPPDDWTDGVCWALNDAGVASTAPTHWKNLADDNT